MQVERLPVLSDNYIFMLLDPEQRTAAVVDPAIASPVLHWLRSHSFNLIAIFNTHHHSDHVGGNAELLRHYPAIPVYAGAEDRGRIPGQTVFLQEGDRVQFGHWQGTVFFVPGHTRSHIAYYFPPVTPEVAGDLFCGDTLFAGGCGRLFEGSPAQMVSSLAKLRQLPGHTQVWCAHEYTLKNLRFALSVEPDNVALQDRYQLVQAQRSRQESTIPSMLEVEKHTNPFLRWDVPLLQQVAAAPGDGIKTFAYLRQARDHW